MMYKRLYILVIFNLFLAIQHLCADVYDGLKLMLKILLIEIFFKSS